MTLMKTNGSLVKGFPTFFDDFFNRDLFNFRSNHYSNTNSSLPAINIRETADAYHVEVAAPGLSKKDFKIQLEDNNLTISCDKVNEDQQNDVRYNVREFSYQSFSRSFELHKEVVDCDKIAAKYIDGVLSLEIPKKETVKQPATKVIEIQ